ncbi:MAG: dTMP kinase [SAR202 cluster bacterium]|nr:dTMP kinase [SAR202 cluster bacterium]
MAVFIVFEGGDGAGKSTQVRALKQRFQRHGLPVAATREPGGTPLGEQLRRCLKGSTSPSPMAELLLFSAARAQLVAEVIQPALSKGINVLCDRFTASTVAYQGYGRGLDMALIHSLNAAATSGLTPQLTILLDLPVEVARQRKESPGDSIEAAPGEFHQRVRRGYLAQAAAAPGSWLVLDGARPKRQLSQEIWQKIQPLL